MGTGALLYRCIRSFIAWDRFPFLYSNICHTVKIASLCLMHMTNVRLNHPVRTQVYILLYYIAQHTYAYQVEKARMASNYKSVCEEFISLIEHSKSKQNIWLYIQHTMLHFTVFAHQLAAVHAYFDQSVSFVHFITNSIFFYIWPIESICWIVQKNGIR